MRHANLSRVIPLLCFGLLVLSPGCSSVDDPCGGECDLGVCDAENNVCVDPWKLSCAEQNGECSADKPYVCDSADTPSYNCGQCGCEGDAVCDVGVCYAPETLALRRDDRLIPDDLPTGDYFALVDYAMSAPALSFQEMVGEIDGLLRADGRRTTLLLGESHGSTDEQAVAIELIRDLSELGWPLASMGIEGEQPLIDVEPIADLGLNSYAFGGDLTNDVHCADAITAEASSGLNHQGMHIQYTGSGHTSKEICHQIVHWPICNLPHTSECVSKEGRKAVTVILFDPEPWLWGTDRTLLWRLGDLLSNPTEFEAAMEANLTRWHESMNQQVQEADFDAEVNGTALNVRIVAAEHAEDVFIAYFARPGRPAYLAESYRAIWQKPELQSVLIANDMTPGSCSVSWDLSPGNERLYLWCTGNGFELTATVDGNSFDVLDSDSGPESSSRIIPVGTHQLDMTGGRVGY